MVGLGLKPECPGCGLQGAHLQQILKMYLRRESRFSGRLAGLPLSPLSVSLLPCLAPLQALESSVHLVPLAFSRNVNYRDFSWTSLNYSVGCQGYV